MDLLDFLLLLEDDFEARLPLEEDLPDELLADELPFLTVDRAVLPEDVPELPDDAAPERTLVVIPPPDCRLDGMLVGRSLRLRVRAVVVFCASESP
ncbi:hypothetical protein ACFL6Q_07200 [Candidatus Neomarinimicrobiota bacterium]